MARELSRRVGRQWAPAIVGSMLTARASDLFGVVPTGVVAAATAGLALLAIVAAPRVGVAKWCGIG